MRNVTRVVGTSLLVLTLGLISCNKEKMMELRASQYIQGGEDSEALNTYFEGLVDRARDLIDAYGAASDPMSKDFSPARIDTLKEKMEDYAVQLRIYVVGNPPLEDNQISKLQGLASTLDQYSSGERENMADRYPLRSGND
ncbi:MAG: hypothetical protein ABH849_00890 [Nanoarchaeota archaeon]